MMTVNPSRDVQELLETISLGMVSGRLLLVNLLLGFLQLEQMLLGSLLQGDKCY